LEAKVNWHEDGCVDKEKKYPNVPDFHIKAVWVKKKTIWEVF
jgi:hypothetical protein